MNKSVCGSSTEACVPWVYALCGVCVAYGMLQTSWYNLAHVIAPSLGLPAAAKATSEQYLQQEDAIK